MVSLVENILLKRNFTACARGSAGRCKRRLRR